MMSEWALLRELDCARCVVIDEERGLIGVWHGGATFNVYTADGRCVDCFTVYDCDANDAQAALIEHIRGGC